MTITKPTLPPKAGYVERIIDGVAQYVPTEATMRMLALQRETVTWDAMATAIREGVNEV